MAATAFRRTILITLNQAQGLKVIDDGEKWIIEKPKEPNVIPAAFQPLWAGATKDDLVFWIRENGTHVDFRGRKSISAFWDSYTEYQKEQAGVSRVKLHEKLQEWIKHADPIEEEMLLSSDELQKRLRATTGESACRS